MLPFSPSPNFAFLNQRYTTLGNIATLAEGLFNLDPSSCLGKLRLFSELLTQEYAARLGSNINLNQSQFDLLNALDQQDLLPSNIKDHLHSIRKEGNAATHKGVGTHSNALSMLKLAREVAIWFYKTLEDPNLQAGPFVPPRDPNEATQALRNELARLRQELEASQDEEERARTHAQEAAYAALSAEERALQEQQERAVWEQLAQEVEQEKAKLETKLVALQAEIRQHQSSLELAQVIQRAKNAAKHLEIDEATTRSIIDQQLRDLGWEANSTSLRYSEGTRPEAKRMLAIAEWPCEKGHADYALFVGLTCVGVIEAKRQTKHVSSALQQAERYALSICLEPEQLHPDGPWVSAQGEYYRVPFAFASNGRPYLKQLETMSGIWFRDLRNSKEQSRALQDWFSPQALTTKLQQDTAAAQEQLVQQQFAFAFPLRPYQRSAIEAVEAALATGKRQMLLAMATGSGKTKLSIAMLYRLLQSKRFRSICFVVDRTALGEQAFGEFSSTQVITGKRFADIFAIKGLNQQDSFSTSQIQICTIQSLVRRVLEEDSSQRLPIDQFDLLVVDECHRGYLQDRELSDIELSFRDQNDYISKYRKVLEYFDAVKIGLTATPALHTSEIFGPPIFTYSYREAVIDGFLVDQEPPISFSTELSQAGIHFEKDEEVEVLDTETGTVDKAKLPDQVSFEVEKFNRKVITRSFNATIAKELAEQYISLSSPGKTLVFAVNNLHADLLVEELRKAFAAAQGAIPDEAIMKITGSVDDPERLIRSFRNDEYPKIAVTVDLLTTGIDIPKITNLVFMRRVNSRILYEQMLGRATRLCDEIDKESFQVYDAVDLYSHIEQFSDMKPVAQDPDISLSDLFLDLTHVPLPEQQEVVRDQLVLRLRRIVQQMDDAQISDYQKQIGQTPQETLRGLLEDPIEQSVQTLRDTPQIAGFFTGLSYYRHRSGPLISHHEDRLKETKVDYHGNQRPDDYLEQFNRFVHDNLNKLAALNLVVTRPKDLDRQSLRQLQQVLAEHHFSETALKSAWASARNEEIAASIIGYIRQAALGDPLVPYEQRVQHALRKILNSRQWSKVQQDWLRRIADQVIKQQLSHVSLFEVEPFAGDGGTKSIQRILKIDPQELMEEFSDLIWAS
jgi:type I restriction enzyme R subunit